ncbi:LysR family transcriptional regulator [Euzebya sp.]|uniref:LysR family transcriptional regulator n=1 Tax=Euzebya sp. TaxID=1971409 RepID=UPI003519D5A7
MDIDSRITLQKLEVLSAVVRHGGVGRAADALVVTQPVVSSHLRSLSDRVGVELFYREGRFLRLTEAGEAVHRWAEDVLTRTRELDRHLSGLSDGHRGVVHIGATKTLGSYVLPELLAEMRRRHPAMEVVLAVADTEGVVDATRAGELDLAVAVTSPRAQYPDLAVRQLGSAEIVVVAAPGLVPSGRVTVEELARLPFVEPEGDTRRTYVEDQLRAAGVGERTVAMRLGHPEAMKRAASAGLGVTLLFRRAVLDELATGALVELAVDGLSIAAPISLLSRPSKTFSPLHAELIEMIEAAL